MFIVVSRSDVHFGFEQLFFACPIGPAILLARRKIGRLERNLFTPVTIEMVDMLVILTIDTFYNHIKGYIIQVTSKYLLHGETSFEIILKS